MASEVTYCRTVLRQFHRLSLLFQVPLSLGWRRCPGLDCYGFLRCACLHSCSVCRGSDLFTQPTGSPQTDFLLSNDLADTVSPGPALHWVLSARTSFHEVKQFVHLIVLSCSKVSLHRGGNAETGCGIWTWILPHLSSVILSKSFNLSWPRFLFLEKKKCVCVCRGWGKVNKICLARLLF